MNDTKQMGDMLDMAERYQRTFVKPLVDAVTAQIDDHLGKIEGRLTAVEGTSAANIQAVASLKANEKKALVGWSLYASGAAALLAYGWTWIKGHFKIG